MPPKVTIILPTYNREPFLPKAFASISSQTFTDWELIVVDDGSTDGTRALVERFAASAPRPVVYVHQENRGAYSARNRGLDRATGELIAFYDSDDEWLPRYLEVSVAALEAHKDVDWVYAACRMIDSTTGQVLQPTHFHAKGQKRPFLDLKTEQRGDLSVIVDRGALECHLLHGIQSGLQHSVIRGRLFEGRRFWEESRVVDDQLFVARMLAAGRRFAYFLEPYVVYHVHEENSSGSASGKSAQKLIGIFQEMVVGLEQLRETLTLTPRERRALARRLSREYFWQLGYMGLWQAGRRTEAVAMYRRSLSLWPWAPSRWKTYLLARARVAGHAESGTAA